MATGDNFAFACFDEVCLTMRPANLFKSVYNVAIIGARAANFFAGRCVPQAKSGADRSSP